MAMREQSRRRSERPWLVGPALVLALARPAVAQQTSAPVLGTETIANLAARTAPAVVNIDTLSQQADPTEGLDPFFHHFFGRSGGPRVFETKGVGSGFAVSPDGLILTNWHVVRGAQRIVVTFPDGRHYRGTVAGADELTDLALLRIQAHGLPALAIAPQDGLRVGEWVVAIGSPLGLSTSVTAGIVSALGRDLPLNLRIPFIQTDAPINPGNSGGPLLDLEGSVVGITTAIARNTTGIGFAIPARTIRRILPQLIAKGHVERAWLGILIDPMRGALGVPTDGSGVRVGKVEPGSPAEKAGIQPGDRILAIDGTPVREAAELLRALGGYQVGERVLLSIERQGTRSMVAIKLGRMPTFDDPTEEDNGAT